MKPARNLALSFDEHIPNGAYLWEVIDAYHHYIDKEPILEQIEYSDSHPWPKQHYHWELLDETPIVYIDPMERLILFKKLFVVFVLDVAFSKDMHEQVVSS